MIKIYAECTRFNTTSQGLADQVRMILKKGWFSDLEILKICGQLNSEEYEQVPLTQTETKILKSKNSLLEFKCNIPKTKIPLTPTPQGKY